jgi:signal transduction histidine kinase
MSTFAGWLNDRRHIQLVLRWRWLVLAIGIPITLALEILEARSIDLRFLTEVFVDVLVVPLSIWVVLTSAAQNIARQFEREEILEQRQRFRQRLAEHGDYGDLSRFIVRFPSTLLPLDHASLFVYDHRRARLNFVTEWNAVGGADSPTPGALATPVICRTCLLAKSSKMHHTGACAFAPDQPWDSSGRDTCLPLSYDNLLIGVLRLRWSPFGKTPTAGPIEFMTTLSSEMALALALAIANSHQADRVCREAQIHERRRITRELHDSLAQEVFYLRLGLDQLAGDSAWLASDVLQRKVESMRDVAADVYEQIRNDLSILRTWEQVDFSEAVTRLARMTAHDAALTIEIEVQGKPHWLSPHTCETMYAVIREALNNVVKHARARHVQLELTWSAESLSIRLVDDGVGFDPAHLRNEGHYGLALMREGLEALQAVFTLDSRPGNGTCLQASIPLQLPDPHPRQWTAWPQELRASLDVARFRL